MNKWEYKINNRTVILIIKYLAIYFVLIFIGYSYFPNATIFSILERVKYYALQERVTANKLNFFTTFGLIDYCHLALSWNQNSAREQKHDRISYSNLDSKINNSLWTQSRLFSTIQIVYLIWCRN